MLFKMDTEYHTGEPMVVRHPNQYIMMVRTCGDAGSYSGEVKKVSWWENFWRVVKSVGV